MAIVRRAAAKAGRVDAATASKAVNRINRAEGRKADVRKAADRKAAGPIKAAGRSRPVLRSKAARRRAKAAPAASPARTVAAYGGPPPRRPRPQGPGQGRPHEFKPKPKPLIPITDAMKKGKEPMRTFGDLMQFFEAKTDDKKPPVAEQEGAGREAARP